MPHQKENKTFMKQIDLTKLQNAEHYALMSDIANLLSEANIEALNDLKQALDSKVLLEELAQKQIRKSEHTETLIELDQKRNNLYRGLVLRIQSEELSYLQDRKTAAQKLLVVVTTYGNLATQNYQKETAELQNFLTDLKSDIYQESVTKLGIQEWVNWLEAANNEFAQTYTERRDEYASKPNYDLRLIRKESDALFKKIQQTADALDILQPSASLKVFISKAEASITKWRDLIAQRNGKKTPKKANEKEEGV